MSSGEMRALRRSAGLLLLISTARWGWAESRAGAARPEPSVLPELLRESRALVADREARRRPLEPGERIDPNRATEAELDRLPGVGPSTARAIVRSREAAGPFRTARDLERVPGIGPVRAASLEPHLDVSATPGGGRDPPARPRGIDLNRAGVEELTTLPGIGPALARRIVDARAEAPFDGVDELLRVRGIGPATVARLKEWVGSGR